MMIVYCGLDLLHEVLDAPGGDGVEGRAGLVHEDDLGVGGQGPGDAEPLLLATGQAEARGLEAVLDLVPQGGLAEAALDDLVEGGALLGDAGGAGAVGHVVVDRLGERVGLLEDHPDPAPDLDRVDLAVVEVDAVVVERALDPGDLDEVVHAVEAAQHRGLAAARRADEGGDLVLLDVELDVAHGPEVAVVDGQVVDVEDGGAVGGRAPGRRTARASGRALSRSGRVGHGAGLGGEWAGGRGHGGHLGFFSKRLRRKMPTALMPRITTRVTTMAAAGCCRASPGPAGSFVQSAMMVRERGEVAARGRRTRRRRRSP